jgi:hypothetical protein
MEGSEQWLAPMGKVFCVLSAFVLISGAAWFVRQEYVLHSWPTTKGVVTDSQLITRDGDNGVLCSATYQVAYTVGTRQYAAQQVEHTSTSECADWRAKVASAKGKLRNVLYDPTDPKTAYFDAGFNSDFLIVPFWCVCFSVLFTTFGVAAWKIGNYMTRRGLQAP